MESKRETQTLKFLCSYSGKILPRHTDGRLRYVGGLTRVLSVDRSVSFAELMVKLGEFCGSSVTLKCQLPNGDLETLISIKSDEDLGNLVEEYDRASSSLSHPLKIRSVLSPPKSLKQISPPPSSDPSVNFSAVNDSLPNSPLNRYCSRTPSPTYSCVKQTSSPSFRSLSRTSSPPSWYQLGSRNCSGRTFYYPCHVHGSPMMLYSGPHCSNCH